MIIYICIYILFIYFYYYVFRLGIGALNISEYFIEFYLRLHIDVCRVNSVKTSKPYIKIIC